MPAKMPFPRKRQIAKTNLLSDKLSEKSLSLVAFASIFEKKLLTFKVSAGTFSFYPPFRVKKFESCGDESVYIA